MPVNGNVQVQRSVLPDGIAGVDATVRKMVELAHSQYGSKSAKVRALAIDILRDAGVPDKDYYGEMVAIHNWVRDNIRYVRDPIGQETLSYPEETAFNSRAGDCLDENTRLLTPKGYIHIKDARSGMIIQGKRGWTKILNVWDKGNLPTQEYRLDNGGSFVATAEHRCFLLDGSEKKAGDLVVRDALLGPAQVSFVGNKALSLDDCFFIGIFLSDGWVDGNRVCVAGKDGFAKEAQKRWVETYAASKGWKTSWHPRYIRVYADRKDRLASFLFNSGIAPDKSLPDEIVASLDAERAKRLLDGLLSDSYQPGVSKRAIGAELSRKRKTRGGTCYSTVSHDLAKQVRLLFRLTGVSVCDTLVVDHGGLGTNPVHRIYPRYFLDKPARVKSAEPIGVRHVWDIQTEDSGIYLPDADIVVHNCDDLSTLEMALLGSVGIESYPVVVGMFPGHFSHVYIHGKVPAGKGRNAGKIIPLDPIMKDWQAGREAIKGIKAKKTYPQLSNPLTMNGLPMGQDIGDLGAYAVGPSYLDEEDSHAGLLLVPDQKASNVHNDKTVANASRVNMPFEGIDGMFSGMGAGDSFNETSAGDGGTIVQSGGQLVPKGFIRREPDLRQVMSMTPATAKQLGPRGPIFNRKEKDETRYLKSEGSDNRIASLARELRDDKTVRVAEIRQVVGTKRYDLPSVQQRLRQGKGLVANPVRNITKKQVVVLNSIPLDRLGESPKKLPTLGEDLASAEMELAGVMHKVAQANGALSVRQPMAQREAWQQERAQLLRQINSLEQRILALRQQQRGKTVKQDRGIRANAIRVQQTQTLQPVQPVQPMNGLGEGFVDIIKKPLVWGPIVAFAGVFALRMYLKKRRSAATPA